MPGLVFETKFFERFPIFLAVELNGSSRQGFFDAHVRFLPSAGTHSGSGATKKYRVDHEETFKIFRTRCHTAARICALGKWVVQYAEKSMGQAVLK
jgi:hypothetical protein